MSELHELKSKLEQCESKSEDAPEPATDSGKGMDDVAMKLVSDCIESVEVCSFFALTFVALLLLCRNITNRLGLGLGLAEYNKQVRICR